MARFKRPPPDERHRAGKADVEADTPRNSPLIAPGGRVDKEAVFRAAQADLPPGAGAVPTSDDPADDEAESDEPESLEADDERDEPLAIGAPQAQRVVFRLTRDLQKRLDKYLTDRISFMSRAQLQRLIDEGGVTVNARIAKSSTKLRLGDVVTVLIPPPPAAHVPPQDIPLEVLFEDEHLIVVNKSPDIIVHPARSHLSGTMINALTFHFQNRSSTGGDLSAVGKEFARPGVVHRLDRQTSGVIVFAKTEHAHWKLANQFMDRTVDKRYIAFTHGHVQPLVDVIDLPLGPHPSRLRGYREMHVVRHDHLGKPAVTLYRVLGHYVLPGAARNADAPSGLNRDSDRVSLVEVELKTGRTHQIRVHLTHQGHPLLADDMYGGRIIELGGEQVIGRVALHAALLAFRHPLTGVPMRFTAPLTADLRRALLMLRSSAGAFEPSSPPGAVLSLDELNPRE